LLGPTGFVANVNPANPAAGFSPSQVDPEIAAPITHVFVGGVEHELMPDFSVGVNLGRSSATNAHWAPFVGLSSDHFAEYRPVVPAGVSLTTPVYRLASGVTLPPGNARMLTNRDGYARNYWNVDVLATKRLTNRWMFRGFVTWQQHRESFDDPARSIQDPTPRLEFFPYGIASGLADGGIAVNLGGGEFVMHSTWLYSAAGLYELPWGVSVSGTLYGRQGSPVGEFLTVNRPDGLGLTRVFLNRDLDVSRYSSPHFLDLRVQKQLTLGRTRAIFAFDVFNTVNDASILREFTDAATTTFGRPVEIVAPRLVRLGLQLRF
jgi:hypothetical protein